MFSVWIFWFGVVFISRHFADLGDFLVSNLNCIICITTKWKSFIVTTVISAWLNFLQVLISLILHCLNTCEWCWTYSIFYIFLGFSSFISKWPQSTHCSSVYWSSFLCEYYDHEYYLRLSYLLSMHACSHKRLLPVSTSGACPSLISPKSNMIFPELSKFLKEFPFFF